MVSRRTYIKFKTHLGLKKSQVTGYVEFDGRNTAWIPNKKPRRIGSGLFNFGSGVF
jgi:hypothetical protein